MQGHNPIRLRSPSHPPAADAIARSPSHLHSLAQRQGRGTVRGRPAEPRASRGPWVFLTAEQCVRTPWSSGERRGEDADADVQGDSWARHLDPQLEVGSGRIHGCNGAPARVSPGSESQLQGPKTPGITKRKNHSTSTRISLKKDRHSQ